MRSFLIYNMINVYIEWNHNSLIEAIYLIDFFWWILIVSTIHRVVHLIFLFTSMEGICDFLYLRVCPTWYLRNGLCLHNYRVILFSKSQPTWLIVKISHSISLSLIIWTPLYCSFCHFWVNKQWSKVIERDNMIIFSILLYLTG